MICGMTEAAKDVVERRGRISANGGPTERPRRGVQGVARRWRDEVGEHSPGVGVHDGQLAIGLLADQKGHRDVQRTTAVELLQSRP
jgi:hypothetical protein